MAVNTSKYAIQKVFSIKLFDLATGQALAVLEEAKETTFTHNQETVYAMGGRANAKLVGFDHSKDAMISGSNALITDGILSTQYGQDVVELTDSTEILFTDVVTVSSDAATTTHTATGTAGSEIKYAYVRNSDGSLGTELTQGGAVAAGVFTYTSGSKALAFNPAELADGTEIVLFYYPTLASGKKFVSSTEIFSKEVKMVADCLFRDACNGTDYAGQIVFDKAKMSGAFEYSVSADGEPAVQSFELTALKSCASDDLVKQFIYDTADLS